MIMKYSTSLGYTLWTLYCKCGWMGCDENDDNDGHVKMNDDSMAIDDDDDIEWEIFLTYIFLHTYKPKYIHAYI